MGRPVEIVAALDPDWAALASAGIDKANGRSAPISVSGEVTVAFLGELATFAERRAEASPKTGKAEAEKSRDPAESGEATTPPKGQ